MLLQDPDYRILYYRIRQYAKNNQFVTKCKILHSLKGKFLLEGEREKLSVNFVEQFLWLLERLEGTLLLVFVDVKQLGEKDTKHCAVDW